VPSGAEGIADITDYGRVFAKVQVVVADAAPIDIRLLPGRDDPSAAAG
jgi:hypothetical protein